jgi:hypothetical protein
VRSIASRCSNSGTATRRVVPSAWRACDNVNGWSSWAIVAIALSGAEGCRITSPGSRRTSPAVAAAAGREPADVTYQCLDEADVGKSQPQPGRLDGKPGFQRFRRVVSVHRVSQVRAPASPGVGVHEVIAYLAQPLGHRRIHAEYAQGRQVAPGDGARRAISTRGSGTSVASFS